MENVLILMGIFSICIFIYGLYIFSSKNPSLPYTYHGRRDKKYLKYLGKMTMISSLIPIVCTCIFWLITNIIISFILSVIFCILVFVLGIKIFS